MKLQLAKRFNIIIKAFIHKDPSTRFELLRLAGKWLYPTYRFKWPVLNWWQDKNFSNFLKRFEEDKKLNADRRWMVFQLLRLVENIEGDTAECGVYKGAGSYIISKVNSENKNFNRTHHLFDSFEGLSEPTTEDGKYWKKGDLSYGEEYVANALKEFTNLSFHKGWIPDRFKDVDDKKFCFVHIDVDLYQPTLDSFSFFYDRMPEGGIIVCDDYDSMYCPGATRAIDEFLKDKPEKMLSLTASSGFMIKGNTTKESKWF